MAATTFRVFTAIGFDAFRRRIEPATTQPFEPFLGERVPIVSKAELENSAFTAAHLRGGTPNGYRTTSGLAVAVGEEGYSQAVARAEAAMERKDYAAAEQALLDAYRGGRIAHAWLIGGPAGIGKATLAFRFARFVLAASETEALAAVAAAEVVAAVPDVEDGDQNTFLFTSDLVAEPEDLVPSPIPNPAPLAGSLWLDPQHPVFRRVASGGHPDLITLERRYDEKRGQIGRASCRERV